MAITTLQFLVIAVALFGGSVVNSAIGFASAVFALPLLLMAGVDLPSAITLNLVAAAFQTFTASIKLRGEIDFPTLARPIAIRLLTLPLGVALLVYTHHVVQPQRVRQIVGILLLAVLSVQWFWRVKPRQPLHPVWEYLAFSCSGIMMGFIGMGGPAMVLWVMANRWPPTKSRAFMFAAIASGIVPYAVILMILFDQQFVPAFFVGLLCVPLVLVGTMLGLNLGARMQQRLLRRVTYVVLVGMALAATLSPLMPRGGTTTVAGEAEQTEYGQQK